MEKTDLTNPRYWDLKGIDIRINSALSIDRSGLESAIREQGIHSAICLATSGSEGWPKMVVLTREAILHSAASVNRYCGITKEDIWLGGLSTFHVGGIGIYARAFLSCSRVNPMKWNQWTRDGKAFLEACGDATVTSLTPVHLHDLVAAGVLAPRTLRGVFIGGAALNSDLADRARQIGWPLWPTFGMTETCSQVATSLDGDPLSLPVLDHWDVRETDELLLALRGPSLMEGFFQRNNTNHSWQWSSGRDENGFYCTRDRVRLHDGRLTPLGRADRNLKILGELVSLEKLESFFASVSGRECMTWGELDERRGYRLYCAIEGMTSDDITRKMEKSNTTLPPFERIESFEFREEFPRTPSGKIDRRAVTNQ